jgi:NAD(P)-dependent dehydrogenase (short-subunit alcohol dehydrogenase family)
MNQNCQTILITGSAKRLGKFLAISFAQIGYNIALHYNSSEKEVVELQNIIQSKKVKCQIFQADLQNIKNCQKLINDVKNHFGKINILINNSSVFIEGSFQDTTEAIFDENFNVNYKSIFFLSQFFSKNNSGNIINILDTKINKRLKRFFTYINSKKALYQLNQDLALDLAPNIRVNAIAPGTFLPSYNFDKKYIEKKAKEAPLNRYTKMEDIFKTTNFFINNDFLTGQIIYVDGGENLVNLANE